MKEDKSYLMHILDAISKIKTVTTEIKKEKFIADEIAREYVVRKIEIIGEAVKHLSKEIKQSNRDIRWISIAGMRDKLIHDYMGIDYGIVWEVVETELPNLEKRLEKYWN